MLVKSWSFKYAVFREYLAVLQLELQHTLSCLDDIMHDLFTLNPFLEPRYNVIKLVSTVSLYLDIFG